MSRLYGWAERIVRQPDRRRHSGGLSPVRRASDKRGQRCPVVNVVGGVVVLTVSAVVPLVLAKAALSLVLSLMAVPRSADPIPPPMQPDSAAAPATRAASSSV
jgi:hypothetical protein